MKLKMLGAALLLLVGVIYAQPDSGMHFGPQNMDAVRIWKLTEILELTEDQTVSFLPLVQIHERKLRDLQHELMEIGTAGQTLSQETGISQKDVDKMLKEYIQKQAEIATIKSDFVKSLPKYLTPKQQVLYLGFEARFRKDLREFMKDRHGSSDRSRRGQKK